MEGSRESKVTPFIHNLLLSPSTPSPETAQVYVGLESSFPAVDVFASVLITMLTINDRNHTSTILQTSQHLAVPQPQLLY